MDWEKESASVFIHFMDVDPAELFKEMMGEAYRPEDKAEGDVEVVFTRAELETMLGALDYVALAMTRDGYPTALVDDLADKLTGILEE